MKAPDSAALASLGKLLFEDKSLSNPPGQACASCHEKANAFTGNDRSKVVAVAGSADGTKLGVRNAPTVMYAQFVPPLHIGQDEGEQLLVGGLFVDGRVDSLEEQAKAPLLNELEMNNSSKAEVIAKVRKAPYAVQFAQVYGNDIFDDADQAFDAVAKAIAAYERTEQFAPFSSKFDRVLRGDAKLTELEAKGFELFKDKEKGNCLACHVGDETSKEPKEWLFTDFTYDSLGVPRNPEIPANTSQEHFDLGVCNVEKLGKLGFQKPESLCGAFRVPTLRNIAVTGPYMHNGHFKTLRDAVAFYATRDTSPEKWYPNADDGKPVVLDDLPSAYHGNINTDEAPYDRKLGEAPRLNDEEIDAIVAFLKTLTDEAY